MTAAKLRHLRSSIDTDLQEIMQQPLLALRVWRRRAWSCAGQGHAFAEASPETNAGCMLTCVVFMDPMAVMGRPSQAKSPQTKSPENSVAGKMSAICGRISASRQKAFCPHSLINGWQNGKPYCVGTNPRPSDPCLRTHIPSTLTFSPKTPKNPLSLSFS